jgi:RNA-binding protein 39
MSPQYDAPPPPREPPPPKDPATALLDEVDSESRSILVSQLSARLTSSDLGLFFEDKLGRGSVRDARVVTDRVSRRSKGCVGSRLKDSADMSVVSVMSSWTQLSWSIGLWG